jgi:hypothetical protein
MLMDMIWPLFIVGLVVLAVGIFLIIYRVRVRKLNSRIQRAPLGTFGDKVASATPEGSIGAVGVFAIAFGIILILFGIFYRAHA